MPVRRQASAITEPRGHRGLSVRSLFRIAVVAACIALSACTTVGMHTKQRVAVEYGPPVPMRVCVLKAPGVTTQRVSELVAAVNNEFAAYGIEVVVPWVRPWARSGFTFQRLFADVTQRPLEPPCDRLMAFVDRNVGDFLWGLAMPEVLGAVNDDTHTHGYVVATGVSLNQLFSSPTATTVHEFYHFLGCPHAGAMSECYRRIAALKNSFDPRTDLFPGIARNGRFLRTRNEIHFAMHGPIGMQSQREVLAADMTPEPATP